MLFEIVWLTLLFVGLGLGWLLTLFNLPGNWLMVIAAAGYTWFLPAEARWQLNGKYVVVLVALAVVGEVVETAASAMRVRRLGGSRRGAFLSMVFSFVGAVVGTAAIPLPIVGTLLGACLGALVGAFA